MLRADQLLIHVDRSANLRLQVLVEILKYQGLLLRETLHGLSLKEVLHTQLDFVNELVSLLNA